MEGRPASGGIYPTQLDRTAFMPSCFSLSPPVMLFSAAAYEDYLLLNHHFTCLLSSTVAGYFKHV